jgi:hypothetical protein
VVVVVAFVSAATDADGFHAPQNITTQTLTRTDEEFIKQFPAVLAAFYQMVDNLGEGYTIFRGDTVNETTVIPLGQPIGQEVYMNYFIGLLAEMSLGEKEEDFGRSTQMVVLIMEHV